MNTDKFVKLIPLTFFSIVAFGLNNLFQIPDWYDEIQQATWTLSFQQVDMAELSLYAVSGFAFWLIWKDRSLSDLKWTAFAYFSIVLFSSVWSLLFFGLASPLAAFLDMLVLTAALTITASQFFRYHRIAGYLLIPLIAGAFFFAVNNFQLYQTYLEITGA